MMLGYVLPVLYALGLWWAGTVAVMYLGGLPQRTFALTMAGATALLLAALIGLAWSAQHSTLLGAYVAASCGVGIWAWLEVSFYTGYVTGPRRHHCQSGCRGWRHFRHALAASLHHELAIAALLGLTLVLSWEGENRIGLWTLLVLVGMHESARLNVFLGVRNLNAEFLPPHLGYLGSFLRRRPMNVLFPVSVTLGTLLLALTVRQAAVADTVPVAAGFAFISALVVLGLLEHWLLVLPISQQCLWRWGLSSRPSPAVTAADQDQPSAQTNLAPASLSRRAG